MAFPDASLSAVSTADDGPGEQPVPFARPLAAGFALLSAWRRARVFHPVGVGLMGTAELEGVGRLWASTPDAPVVARFSRGVGLPEVLPDVNGLALKLPDAHGPGRDQDLLLVTSGSAPFARHLLLPVYGFDRWTFTSVLPYEREGDLLMVGARIVSVSGSLAGSRLRRLADLVLAATSGTVGIDLFVGPAFGRWHAAGHVVLDGVLDPLTTEALAFDPANTADELEPWGWLNRVRHPVYRASQAARSRTRR
ncbi:MAG: hypothetical protein JWN46_3504 [Acidimicrobiales bacterium]|nr:hypothetical protein [Acidimicrobiales bacterium]